MRNFASIDTKMQSQLHARLELDKFQYRSSFGHRRRAFRRRSADAAIAEYKAGILRFPTRHVFTSLMRKHYWVLPDFPKLQNEAATLLEKAVKLAQS
jgi:hypothetical protein